MLIKKIAFGDKTEAFIESRLTDGLNVIYSDDNNRGKTLVMQGMMYSLGYEAIFPSSFNYKDKYFYSEIEINEEKYEFLRKRNSIVVKTDSSMQVFNSVSELKYFFDKFILSIPRIKKENKSRAVDFSLFYELFFIGQDNRSPSGLISKGQFNKFDFKNMVYELAGFSHDAFNQDDINEMKGKISNLKIKLKESRKKITLIKSNPDIAEVFSKSFDSERVQSKIRSISNLNKQMSKLRRSRQREINRKSKLEQLVSELNSLNRDLSEGKVKCGECGSERIVYSNSDLTFEVSNIDVRNGILKSISENINQKFEIIDEYSREINFIQNSLREEMSDTPPSFQQMIVYQDQALSDKNYDNEAFSISQQIESLNEQLISSQSIGEVLKSDRALFDKNLLENMTMLYRAIDPNGNLEFDDIFTKRDSTFSGSESQEFYFCKVVALSNILKHDFPIIVDSFRDGELSTVKEDSMLKIYASLEKQIVLTSTLKDEEYKFDKYRKNININAIDYSSHTDCKILKEGLRKEFSMLVDSFSGVVM